MIIQLPSFGGLRELPQGVKELGKILEMLAGQLNELTSNGVRVSENVHHESVTAINESSVAKWVTIEHSLGKTPLCYAIKEGGSASVLDSQMNDRTVSFKVIANSKTKIVLM